MKSTTYQPNVLVDTTNLSREKWLEYRRLGIGGSDVAAILGISPFRTARDLYYDKLNILRELPIDTPVAICGDSRCYYHEETDRSVICLDCEDLDALYNGEEDV